MRPVLCSFLTGCLCFEAYRMFTDEMATWRVLVLFIFLGTTSIPLYREPGRTSYQVCGYTIHMVYV